MGKHTAEWIKNEAIERAKHGDFSLSLDQSNYRLPLLSVMFGEEYIPIPQERRLNAILTNNGKITLKQAILNGVRDEVLEHMGYGAGNSMIFFSAEDNEKMFDVVGKIIFEKGPYYVFSQAFIKAFDENMDLHIAPGEEIFNGSIG